MKSGLSSPNLFQDQEPSPGRLPISVLQAHLVPYRVVEFKLFTLGRVEYSKALQIQHAWRDKVLAKEEPSALFLLEHPPVVTLGASFQSKNLLLTPAQYKSRNIDIVSTDRGGDITLHNPGQLVIYPVFDLNLLGKDLHLFLRNLEKAVITAAGAFGVQAYQSKIHTGIWANEKMIASIGIKVQKWVSTHGVSLNCDNDLSLFELIIPCGMEGYKMTSLTQESGSEVTVSQARDAIQRGFESTFGVTFESQNWEDYE